MWRVSIVVTVLAFAGCAQIPPSPQDIEAKSFKSIPDKSVIYIVRGALGPPLGDTLSLNDRLQITTWAGTYYRWEAEPGAHHIQGFASSGASIKLRTEPGKIYFLKHSVIGNLHDGVQNTYLEPLDEATGRAFVRDAQLL